MNVVLIHPYIKVREIETYMTEPLGLLCLASYLDSVFGSEVKVTILDLYALGAENPTEEDGLICLGVSDPAQIDAELVSLKPDLIGIHCNFTAYAKDSLDIADIAKQCFPNVPIVIGGAHPTIEAESILHDCQSIDYVARGEGERILENLVRCLKGEIGIDDVKGLVHRKALNDAGDEQLVTNAVNPLIKDLTTLPIPSRKYIDMDKYNYFNKQSMWYVKNSPVATIMTSRGCPFDCVFCSTKVVWTRKWRDMGLEKVFEEIEMLVRDYGIREIVIVDDQFMTRKKRIHAFCDYFIERKLDLTFWYESGTSTWLIDEPQLRKMRQAGFYAIRLPVESGSEATMKFIKKPVDLTRTIETIKIANKLGYWTSANFIIGFPYETREEIMETISYAYKSALDYSFFFIAKPNSGSELSGILEKEGLINQDNIRASHYFRSDYDTKTMTTRELNEIVNKAESDWFTHKLLFFMVPKNFYNHFWPKVKTFDDIRYFLHVVFTMSRRKIWPIVMRKFSKPSSV